MKLLHAADFHLDSPFQGFTPEQQESLRKASLELPFAVARLCREKECQMLLLSGDLFDGPYTRKSYEALASALEEAKVPVIIAPGNHDHVGKNAPWLSEHWPENVSIFTTSSLQSRVFEDLDCRVYGAGYTAMDCPGLLQSFTASGKERYHIGVLHGDPTAPDSPYCPITRSQVENSGLTYLALGHIHNKAIDIAKTQIVSTNKTISEIAYHLGFQYSQHFTRLFKREVGCTPNEYRAQMVS